MGMFSDIKGRRGTQGGVYFQKGHFVVEINRVKKGNTRKNVGFFAAETTVIEQSSGATLNTGPSEPGSKPAFFVTDDKDPFLDNVADFMRAIMWIMGNDAGIDDLPSSITEMEPEEDDVEEACGEENPYAGLIIGVEAFPVETRASTPEKPKYYSRLKWMSADEARKNIAISKAGA